jgi:hypothetical protein
MMSLLEVAALMVALVAPLVWVLVAVRRSAWHVRLKASGAAAAEAEKLERQRRAEVPPMAPGEMAATFGSCLLILIVVGLVGLVGLAIVLWAWRTVFAVTGLLIIFPTMRT